MTRRDPAEAATGPDVKHEWNCAGGYVYLSEPPYGAQMRYGRPGVNLWFLSGIWVPPKARRAGVGDILMQAVTKWSDARHADLWLYPYPYGNGKKMDQERLALFYRKWGFFHPVGNRPNDQMVRRHA